MAQKIIVLVEDSAADARVVTRAIDKLGDATIEIIHHETAENALKYFQGCEHNADKRIVLMDINLPGTNGLTFLKHLDASHDAVWCAARWLQNKGHHVVVTPTSKSKTHGEWKQHADSGDLYLQQRIEVKKRGIDFTGAGDWPHGDKFIVCSRHSYDLARPKPYAWIILNKAKTHAAIVKAESRTRWVVEKRTDSRYQNYTQEFYFCPLDCVTWVSLADQ